MTAAKLLKRWVALKHKGQFIKRSGEPYLNHLAAVAAMAETAAVMGYEIGLCHDLLEDTATTENELQEAMIRFGYTALQASHVTACVVELTDVFTRAAYPALSKRVRKAKEASRLVSISADAQTVKYCDLIDNLAWVLKYDPKKASKYLKKKRLLLTSMTRGDKEIRQKTLDAVNSGLSAL